MKTTVTAPEELGGERIDALLPVGIQGLTRSAAQRLIAQGLVTLAGRAVPKSYRVSAGETFEVEIPEAEPAEAAPQDIPLEVAFEDSDVIVVNKPRGMVVHPAPGHPDGTLVNALLHHCGDSLSGVGGKLRPGIVHRIDRDTSGLVIAAKNDFAHRKLAAQLSNHTLSRVYETVVRGALPEELGTVAAPIGRSTADRKKMAVTERNSRDAVTHYEVLARYPGFTHARCRLETGRTHQIRVHMAYLGHPILGDEVYGGRDAKFGLRGQCLHARELRFGHPRTDAEICVATDLPRYFEDILEKLGRL
ncbi:MAG: RluA family pseudouridine synthase [Oscillospiraceae bacterium]|jgi:23S rRNA pseudouridine1911/1915/1917 synthase|nr:RluA family pseudouridine synthase [Oscillospiraceae bacterium]